MLTVAATFLMCITSPHLTYGECCHCHFRSSHGPSCSHRNMELGRSSFASPTKTLGGAASGSQDTPAQVKKEKAGFVSDSPVGWRAKMDTRSRVRRTSAFPTDEDDENDVEWSQTLF